MSALTHNSFVDRFIAVKCDNRDSSALEVPIESTPLFTRRPRPVDFKANESSFNSDQDMAARHNSDKNKYFYHNSKVYDRRERNHFDPLRTKFFEDTRNSDPLIDRTGDTRRVKDLRDKLTDNYRSDRISRSKDLRREKHYRYLSKNNACTELDFRSHSSHSSSTVTRNYYGGDEEYKTGKGNYEADASFPREYGYEPENQVSHSESATNKTVYYSIKSDEETADTRDNREVFNYASKQQNHGRDYQPFNGIRNSLNLSPISSTSSALTPNVYFNECNSERANVHSDLFGVNDVDLRFERQNKEIGTEIRCQYQSLGCQIVAKLDSITSHEKECAFNPKNAKTVCKACKLIVNLEHDCLSELREELNSVTKRTDWFKYSNASQSHNFEEGSNYVWVHFYGDKEEKVAKFKVTNTDDTRSVIKKSLEHLGLKSPNCDDVNEDDQQHQLVFSSFHVLSSHDKFDSFTTHFPRETHLILIPKLINIKVTARKLYCENEHVMVSVPTSVPFQIDPTVTVLELKQMIAAKIPVDWSRHSLEYCGKQLIDFMLVYVIGLSNNDKVDIIAV